MQFTLYMLKEAIQVVRCAQRTNNMEIVFNGAQGAPYKIYSNSKVAKKKKRCPNKVV